MSIATAALLSVMIIFFSVGAWIRRAVSPPPRRRTHVRRRFGHPHRGPARARPRSAASPRPQSAHARPWRARDQELRQFNDTLQVQVQQRTASLQEAVKAAGQQAKSLFLANMS